MSKKHGTLEWRSVGFPGTSGAFFLAKNNQSINQWEFFKRNGQGIFPNMKKRQDSQSINQWEFFKRNGRRVFPNMKKRQDNQSINQSMGIFQEEWTKSLSEHEKASLWWRSIKQRRSPVTTSRRGGHQAALPVTRKQRGPTDDRSTDLASMLLKFQQKNAGVEWRCHSESAAIQRRTFRQSLRRWTNLFALLTFPEWKSFFKRNIHVFDFLNKIFLFLELCRRPVQFPGVERRFFRVPLNGRLIFDFFDRWRHLFRDQITNHAPGWWGWLVPAPVGRQIGRTVERFAALRALVFNVDDARAVVSG